MAHLVEGLRVAVDFSPRSSAIESRAFREMRSVGRRKAVREKTFGSEDNRTHLSLLVKQEKALNKWRQKKLRVIGKNYHRGHFSSSVEEALSLSSWQAAVGGQTLS